MVIALELYDLGLGEGCNGCNVIDICGIVEMK